jgi:nitrogenase molybdenum-iron protein alpha/beta subunit
MTRSALEEKRESHILKNNEEQKHISNNYGKKLVGKTAVITGGATGIGLAAARRFIDEGAFEVAVDGGLAQL